MPLASMTGFARAEGAEAGLAWAWELRSVNGRSFDLKLRLPPGLDALEATLRERAATTLRRGNVGANLTLRREERTRLAADPDTIDDLLALALQLAARIPGCPPPRAELLLALPGVIRTPAAPAAEDPAAAAATLAHTIATGFAAALEALVASRQQEGARLQAILAAQVDAIAALCAQARDQAAEQPRLLQARLHETLAALLPGPAPVPPERLAQEIAILATRADVQEELDRLAAHIEAARTLLHEDQAVGRRLDFLVQEFVRETNTLCSKSASIPLTATGLRLKALIEQMREQVQNVE